MKNGFESLVILVVVVAADTLSGFSGLDCQSIKSGWKTMALVGFAIEKPS